MSSFFVSKSSLKGTLKVPSSKSETLRALLFAALAEGKSTVRFPLDSTDRDAMQKAILSMGAKVTPLKDALEIEGTKGKIGPFEDVLNVGNSGICLRFLTALSTLSSYPVVITGDHSIRYQRPMHKLIKALESLGASVTSMRGDHYAPLIIQGPLTGKGTSIQGEDSQPVSALLIASAFKKTATEITVTNPGEIPWIEMTLKWFDKLGIIYKNDSFKRYLIQGNSHYPGFETTVPGDFSSSAFLLGAALITDSPLTLQNLDMDEVQGDKALIPTLQKMGANLKYDSLKKELHVMKGSKLKGTIIDVNPFIDAVPILATVACYAEGKTVITGAAVAREKECDRLQACCQELKKMGANIEETSDGLIIQKAPLTGAILSSNHDHRMAMSLAAAAMGASGETQINDAECVSKTFPTFLKDFQSLGASIHD